MKVLNAPSSAADSVAELASMHRRLPKPSMRRALREKHGISQAAIARAIGPTITRQAVGNWENGLRNPRGEVLAAYVAVLERLAAEESA